MLSGWDRHSIERLAYAYRMRGKEPAKKAYHKFATALGWHGTEDWIEGRTLFKEHWIAHRKSYNDSMVGTGPKE